MNEQSITHNNYQRLLQEVKQTWVEHSFISRWTLIEGYHHIGELLKDQEAVTVTKIANDLGKSERTLRRCKQFYKKYPDLELLPEGKDTSWHKIVNTYLPETIEEREPKLEECPYCHKTWEK